MPDHAHESLVRRIKDHIDNPGNAEAPERLLHFFAKTIENFLLPSSSGALDHIEKYMRREIPVYSPWPDLDDNLRAVDNLEQAVLFLKNEKHILESLGLKREQLTEFRTFINLAERQCRFWSLLKGMDQYLQGCYGPLAELVCQPDFSRPPLTDEEKNGLQRGSSPPEVLERIKDCLKADNAWLSAFLRKLAPDQPQPVRDQYLYKCDMDASIIRPYEKICLALPQVSGFYDICNIIVDHKGTRRGYTDPDTGARVTMNIPQYAGGKFRYGHLLAEANYKQAIETLTDKDETRTLYIVAMPEYYYPRHLHIDADENFIKHLQYIRNNGHGIIFISGLEGLKKDIHSNKPPNNGCYSEALIAYSDSKLWKHHIVGTGQMVIFPVTPLGAIAISTYGSLYAVGKDISIKNTPQGQLEPFEEAIKFILNTILNTIGRDLSYIFVCFMNNEAGQQNEMRKLVEEKICPLLGGTKLVVTDHDCCYTGNKPPRKFAHNSTVYDKKGAMSNYAEINYVLDGCNLFSKLFIIN